MPTPTADHRRSDGEPFRRFVRAVTAVRAYEALRDRGVLDALAADASDEAALAERYGLDHRVVRAALETLAEVGVTIQVDGKWQLTLDPAILARFAAIDVARRMAGDEPELDVGRPADAEALYPAMVETLASFTMQAEPVVVAQLIDGAIDHVVEVAAGASPWGRALCRADPATRVTAIDLPTVIDTTRRTVRDAGMEDRYDFLAGDVFEVEPERRADLVVVAGFCRLLSPDACATLFRRITSWCTPVGRVAIIDAIDTPAARRDGLSAYELGLLTRTTEGGCWSLDQYAGWMADAGLGRIRVTPTPNPEITLVSARCKEAQ